MKERKKVVAIGGGTGLSTLLAALKPLNVDITAIVAVTDDGGSSGRLRRDLGILPPGDIRDCLIALADDSIRLNDALNYKFPETSELGSHSLGNLLISALVAVNGGDFAAGISHLSEILNVEGRVIPVTTDNVSLTAQMSDGSTVCGETSIVGHPAPIRTVSLQPMLAKANPHAIVAIEEADYIFLGPGSLYTSIITNLLVGGITPAIAGSAAKVFYILNLATQAGEMERLEPVSYVRELLRHSRDDLIDGVIINIEPFLAEEAAHLATTGSVPLRSDTESIEALGFEVLRGKFKNKEKDLLWRHNVSKLTDFLRKIIN